MPRTPVLTDGYYAMYVHRRRELKDIGTIWNPVRSVIISRNNRQSRPAAARWLGIDTGRCQLEESKDIRAAAVKNTGLTTEV